MWTVVACLIPAALWGVYVFGLRALLVLAVAVASAVVAEALAARALGRRTLGDGSAVVTGLLVGMTMPPAVPIAIPIVASAFAMLVVKWTFGGLGANWMNPALAGRVFVFFSWTGAMTRWTMPKTLPAPDGFSAATPLGIVKAAQNGGRTGTAPLELLREAGYPISGTDASVTEWLNAHILGSLGINLPEGYVDLFVGNVSGSIGEVSALLLLAGTIVLFARRVVRRHIPVAFFGTFALFTRVFGGVATGQGFFAGDVLFAALTGGLVLALFYMATDTVTTPLTRGGMLVYGAGVGFLTFLLRTFGRFPEAAALAIILMNVMVPLIDRWTQPRRFGLSGREALRGS